MADFERKSVIDVHAGLQPVTGWPFDAGSRSAAACNHAFVIPSAVHRAVVLVDNRLPPRLVKTLSLGLRCGTKRHASTSSGPAGTTRNWPTFPLRTVTDGWAPAPTWSSTPPHAAELDTPPKGGTTAVTSGVCHPAGPAGPTGSSVAQLQNRLINHATISMAFSIAWSNRANVVDAAVTATE